MTSEMRPFRPHNPIITPIKTGISCSSRLADYLASRTIDWRCIARRLEFLPTAQQRQPPNNPIHFPSDKWFIVNQAGNEEFIVPAQLRRATPNSIAPPRLVQEDVYSQKWTDSEGKRHVSLQSELCRLLFLSACRLHVYHYSVIDRPQGIRHSDCS